MMTFMMASAINVGKGDGNDGDDNNKVYKKCAEDKTSMGGRQQQQQWMATTMDGRWTMDSNNNNRWQ